jgi:hypothetical protein
MMWRQYIFGPLIDKLGESRLISRRRKVGVSGAYLNKFLYRFYDCVFTNYRWDSHFQVPWILQHDVEAISMYRLCFLKDYWVFGTSSGQDGGPEGVRMGRA